MDLSTTVNPSGELKRTRTGKGRRYTSPVRPSTFSPLAIVHGYVSPEWARTHHLLWFNRRANSKEVNPSVWEQRIDGPHNSRPRIVSFQQGVADIATLTLDLWAEQHGYTKLQPNLFNL